MIDVALSEFRGFHHQTFVPIRPLTLLIGENSAGKSSFLAALKYIFDHSLYSEASFNKDPFQLGTFAQIAHYRGGKAGRARTFSLSYRSSRSPDAKGSNRSSVTFRLNFSNTDSQAEINSIIVSGGSGIFELRVGAKGVTADIITQDKSTFRLMEDDVESMSMSNYFLRNMPYMIGEIKYFSSQFRKKQNNNIPEKISLALDDLAQQVTEFRSGLPSSVEATSAIRTKPIRTYTNRRSG